MTDQELKDLVAGLAVAQQKTNEQLTKTDEQLAETDAQLARNGAQQAKTDAKLAKTEALVEKLARMYGGVANNQGLVAEEFYFNSLKDDLTLQGIHFDSIDKNITRNRGGVQDEFDILLLNDENVFIIEVKYKAHPKDLQRLIHQKAANFRRLFPAYGKHSHHLGLASFYMDDKIVRDALGQGVTLLQRKGDVIETLPAMPLH